MTTEAPQLQLQHPLLFPVFFLILVLSLLFPPSPTRRYLSIAAITTCAYLFHTRPISPNPSQSYAASLFWVLWFRILLLHLRHAIPENVLYRPSHSESPGFALHLSPLKKTAWILTLFCSPRQLGWSTPQPRIPAPTPSRPEFLKSGLLSLAGQYLLLDALHTHHLVFPLSTPSMLAQPLGTQLFWTAKGAVTARYAMDFQYTLLSTILVAVGVSSPASWPPLFGSWKEAYTIRRLWTKSWHQMLRPLLTDVADALGTNRVATAFLVSALGHATSIFTVSQGRGGVYGQGQFLFFAVFMLVAVAAEQKLGIETWPRWAGYLWTSVVVLYGGRYMADEILRIGMDDNPVPGSIFRPLLL